MLLIVISDAFFMDVGTTSTSLAFKLGEMVSEDVSVDSLHFCVCRVLLLMVLDSWPLAAVPRPLPVALLLLVIFPVCLAVLSKPADEILPLSVDAVLRASAR